MEINMNKKNKAPNAPKRTKVVTAKVSKKTKVVTAVPAEVVAPVPVKCEAEKIWEEIQFLPMEMFALPNQTVSQHCEPLPFAIDPNRLYLSIRSSATLPALEASLHFFTKDRQTQAAELAKRGHVLEVKAYTVELADRFVVVSRAINSQLLAQYLNKRY